MGWYDYIKKYAWDDDRTPYLTRVDTLTGFQAQKEIFVYALFLAILFAIVTLASLAGTRLEPDHQPLEIALAGTPRSERSPAIALYGFTVFAAALWLGIGKHPYAAMYCATAPVAAFLYVLGDGLQADLEPMEKLLLIAFTVLWGWYALRVVAIARSYAHLHHDEPPG